MNQKNHSADNIPQLRFPEFVGEWEKKNFEELFIFSTGKNIKQNEASPEFKTPCVRYGELYHMYQEVINEVINKTNLDKSELLFSDGDEILLPSAGEDPLDIGSASALTVKNVAIGRTINILKPLTIGRYSQIYVTYYINHKLKKSIATLAKGVSISNVYNSDLKKLNILLPTLPEQTRIANFLTAVDEKIQALKKKKGLLEAYKKGVMQRLFSQGEKLSEAGLSGLKDEQDFDANNPKILKSSKSRFRQEDGSNFPDWEVKKLGELGKITTGKLDANAMIENGEYRFYTCAKDFYKIDKYAFDTEALLISGNGANVGYIHYYKGKFNAYQRTYVLDGFEEKIIYIKYFLDRFLYERINAEKKEGNTPYIVMSALSEMPINLPSLPEQTRIANFLSAIDDKIKHNNTQIQKMEVWKKGLLQKMFV